MNWEREIFWAVGVSCLYLAIFMFAELWRIYGKTNHEQTRKLVHFASGTVCLFFAYIFKSHWTVLGLSILFMLIMIITKKLGLLKSVHDVDRKTSGGLYYPFAVYLVFFIALYFDQPHYYLISILVLAVSDSLAALIGKRYGFKLYQVEEDQRSLEGSIIFFTGTFIIVLLGLLLLTPLEREQCVLIAIYLGILVTGFESISLGGTDNLFVPLGTIAVLIKVDEQSVFYFIQQIGILLGLLLAVILIVKWIPKLGLSALIGIALTGYATSRLVAIHWLFPILIGTILFFFFDLFIENKNEGTGIYRIRSVFFVLVVSFIWILIADFAGMYAFLFYTSFTANLTANFGILWQRKSRLVKKGECHTQTPGFIVHMPLVFRAAILSLLFIPATSYIDPIISIPFSLVSCFLGTLVIESIYWAIAAHKYGIWEPIVFLRVTSAISLTVTLFLSIASWRYYQLTEALPLEQMVTNFKIFLTLFIEKLV